MVTEQNTIRMKELIKNIYVKKKPETVDELLKSRMNMAFFGTFVIISTLSLSLILSVEYFRGAVTLMNYVHAIQFWLLGLVILGAFVLPYGIFYFGVNLSNLRENIKQGLVWGLIFGLVTLALRCLLIYKGFSEFCFAPRLTSGFFVYPIFTIVQDVATKGFTQSIFVALLDGQKYKKLGAIILSSFLFALPHFIFGYSVMAAIFVYSVLTGFIYEKTRSVFGVSIIHYICGVVLFAFGKGV